MKVITKSAPCAVCARNRAPISASSSKRMCLEIQPSCLRLGRAAFAFQHTPARPSLGPHRADPSPFDLPSRHPALPCPTDLVNDGSLHAVAVAVAEERRDAAAHLVVGLRVAPDGLGWSRRAGKMSFQRLTPSTQEGTHRRVDRPLRNHKAPCHTRVVPLGPSLYLLQRQGSPH